MIVPYTAYAVPPIFVHSVIQWFVYSLLGPYHTIAPVRHRIHHTTIRPTAVCKWSNASRRPHQ